MVTRLLMVADTHIPKRARDLPPEVWGEVEGADIVIHAGDWVDERLPEVARLQVEGIRFGVVHETGASQGRERRCSTRFPDLDMLVFGHSHIPWDTTSPTGLRLLNPGSPTDRRRQPYCTYLTATADTGQLREVTLHTIRGGRA